MDKFLIRQIKEKGIQLSGKVVHAKHTQVQSSALPIDREKDMD